MVREFDVNFSHRAVGSSRNLLRSIDRGQKSSEESREESSQGGEESREESRPQESGEKDDGIEVRLLLQVAICRANDYDEKEPSKAKISAALSVCGIRS
jgi:hypothetical protein